MYEKPHRRTRRLLQKMRTGLLLLLLLGVARLTWWNHTQDPRFFRFLSSPVGQQLLQLRGWEDPRPLAQRPEMLTSPIQRADELQRQFPSMHVVRTEDYVVASDHAPTALAPILREMERLGREFDTLFADLKTDGRHAPLPQLVVFRDEQAYLGYAQSELATLSDSAGFYDPLHHRFALYVPGSTPAPHAQPDTAVQPGQRTPPASVHAAAGHDHGHDAQRTLRHEATHMLMYQHGIHSPFYAEHPWLTEGLASALEHGGLCSVPDDEPWLLRHFQRQGTLPSLQELIDHRGDTGLFAFAARESREAAYIQSGSLVRFLMQEPYRDRFFAFIRELRAPERLDRVAGRKRSELLMEHLGGDVETLQRRWARWAGL